MFTNKHVVVAMLVAPVLAIMAWFAVDRFIGEQPHAAKAGAAYSLVAKSNCRYASGQCDLANGDFEITLRSSAHTGRGQAIDLASRFPLQQAMLATVEGGTETAPAAMRASDAGARRWSGVINQPKGPESRIRLAVTAQETTYFAEVPVTFLEASE